MFKAVVQEAPSTKSCVLYGLRWGCQIENECCARDQLHNSGLVISCVVSTFCQFSCGLNREASLDSTVEETELVGQSAAKDVSVSSYTALDSELTMCNVSSIDELCGDSGWKDH
jgi:hypothetical protein